MIRPLKKTLGACVPLLLTTAMLLSMLSGCSTDADTATTAPATTPSATLPPTTLPTTTLPTTGMPDLSPSGKKIATPGTIKINEVCADNKTTLACPTGDYCDYIELYNPTDEPLSLFGCGFSDTEQDPFRTVLPDVVVPAGGYALCYAVGGEVYAEQTSDSILWLSFKVSAAGESLWLTAPDGRAIDSMTCPAMGADISYGRMTDGGEMLSLMEPSPRKSNAGKATAEEAEVSLSAESGFYASPFSLSIDVPEGYTLFYTLYDCTDPRTSSTAQPYTAPLEVGDASERENYFSNIAVSSSMYYPDVQIDKATVLRYALRDGQGRWTSVKSCVYFVGFDQKDGYKGLSVVSIVTTPSSLYSNADGIFVNRNWNNRGKEWEREVSFTCFDTDGSLLVSQQLGVRVQGSSTRAYQQKSMALFAREEYDGQNRIGGQLFEGVDSLKSIVLRYDRDYKFGEGLVFSLMRERAADVSPIRPCVVFLEGEYYGIYNMYVRTSAHELADKYQVDKDDVVIIKKGNLEEGTAADLADYNDLLSFVRQNDMSDAENYRAVCERVDIESFIDYICAQTYLCNVDWSQKQNYACWRTRTVDPANPYADGRWRFILFDMDFSMGYANSSYNYDTNAFTVVMPYTKVAAFSEFNSLLWGLLQSEEFCDRFALTFLDMAQDVFSPERACALLEDMIELYAPNMPNHYSRFDGYSSSGAVRDEAMYRSRTRRFFTFFEMRFDSAAQHLKEVMGLSGELRELTLCSGEGGAVLLNTVSPLEGGESVTLRYFDGMTMTAVARPADGYVFAGWEADGILLDDAAAAELQFSMPEGSVTLTAKFIPLS